MIINGKIEAESRAENDEAKQKLVVGVFGGVAELAVFFMDFMRGESEGKTGPFHIVLG